MVATVSETSMTEATEAQMSDVCAVRLHVVCVMFAGVTRFTNRFTLDWPRFTLDYARKYDWPRFTLDSMRAACVQMLTVVQIHKQNRRKFINETSTSK